jgi:hypothetical protein
LARSIADEVAIALGKNYVSFSYGVFWRGAFHRLGAANEKKKKKKDSLRWRPQGKQGEDDIPVFRSSPDSSEGDEKSRRGLARRLPALGRNGLPRIPNTNPFPKEIQDRF